MDPNVYLVIAAIVVIVGLVATVVPVLPGALIVFAGLFLAAWAEGFTRVGAVGLSIIGALALLALAADFVASLLGAKRVGASPRALLARPWAALAGFSSAFRDSCSAPSSARSRGELCARRDFSQAGKVGLGTWLGLLIAAIAKVVIAFLMIATFLAFYLVTM